MNYRILDISAYQQEVLESLGTKSKYWFSGEDGCSYLFKSIKTMNNNNEIVFRAGEDWAEKIACEIAKSLKIPCADYELACSSGVRGVVTKSFIPDQSSYLITGNEIIVNYSSALSSSGVKDADRQNILQIYLILNKIIKNKPAGFNSLPGIKSASDFFAGYLMLDALISNQDRHSENWGLIVTQKGSHHLAPTFDHAASLGRNESEETKISRLESKDKGQQVSSYVNKARSYFYLRGQRLKTLKAFAYFGILRPAAAIQWVDRLELLTDESIKNIIEAVPSEIMSDVSKRFAFEIIFYNKINILALRSFFERNLDLSFRRRQIRSYE